MGRAFRPIANYDSLIARLAVLPSKALIFGKQASRTYDVSYGALDAEMVDFVFREAERLLTNGSLDEHQTGLVRWNRALQYWALGWFVDAESDARASLEYYSKSNPRHARQIERSLALIAEKRTQTDLLDLPPLD